jgi:hypothetical protein
VQLLLQRPSRLDLHVARRRISELTKALGDSRGTTSAAASLQNERAAGLVEPALGADLATAVVAIEAEARRAQAIFRRGSSDFRRFWIRFPSFTISST